LDKKQKISWGISFGSLALVAGMVSYLGISNGDKANNQMTINQGQPSSNISNQQAQNGFDSQQSQDPSQNFDNSFGEENSSQFNQNDSSSNNNFDNTFGNSDQQNQFSNGGRSAGHHHGFDTTTGGT
jgi:hypothetical protein